MKITRSIERAELLEARISRLTEWVDILKTEDAEAAVTMECRNVKINGIYTNIGVAVKGADLIKIALDEIESKRTELDKIKSVLSMANAALNGLGL
jgi:hypothetical protein